MHSKIECRPPRVPMQAWEPVFLREKCYLFVYLFIYLFVYLFIYGLRALLPDFLATGHTYNKK